MCQICKAVSNLPYFCATMEQFLINGSINFHFLRLIRYWILNNRSEMATAVHPIIYLA
ncbi:hypothetical protein Scep_006106 [Stephania cephalantha]|uniref:Uncharacterized protein n=1 Tax=Stephania cephalantha TaxID=152367 RepID=A0AAP0K996_9MAGN